MSNRLGGFIAGQNINVSIGTFTAVATPTFTFASTAGTPAVGQAVQFTTTGTLPTGLSTNTTYYVISTSTNTCQFSTTLGGSAVAFTSLSGSGTHTAVTQRAFSSYAGAPDTVEYLVVAGGGGAQTAGGGGGGLLQASGFAVATGSTLTVTVGAGGGIGTNGSNSVFSSITATGGGYGGAEHQNGNSGGSGGGGGQMYTTAGPYTGGVGISGQGFSGGMGNPANYNPNTQAFGGGGGGGAGGVGTSIVVGVYCKGNGGPGFCSSITGASIFYAGGGGGRSYIGNVGDPWGGGNGGAGGGGGGSSTNGAGVGGITRSTNNGQNSIASGRGGNGGANSGGGGGAANTGVSGAGGSGIVIIRYPQINSAPALVTGSPQVSYSDGYQIYTWTSSGSIIF